MLLLLKAHVASHHQQADVLDQVPFLVVVVLLMASHLPKPPSEAQSLATHEKPAPQHGDQQNATS